MSVPACQVGWRMKVEWSCLCVMGLEHTFVSVSACPRHEAAPVHLCFSIRPPDMHFCISGWTADCGTQ